MATGFRIAIKFSKAHRAPVCFTTNLESSCVEGQRLMWVKGHSRVESNEAADKKAKGAITIGKMMHQPSIAHRLASDKPIMPPTDATHEGMRQGSHPGPNMYTDKGPPGYGSIRSAERRTHFAAAEQYVTRLTPWNANW